MGIVLTHEQLQEIVRLHGLWLQGKADGQWADLSRADLSRADLSRADLYGANLSWANLSGANLSWADLSRADLSGANLSGANLSGANLSGANLSGADLSRADLSGANLSEAAFKIAGQTLAVASDMSNFTRIVGSQHDGFRVGDYLKIGCQEHHIDHWLEHVRDIAKEASYTPLQVEEYASLVQHVARMASRKKV